MKSSSDRFLTTHVGSLPRPDKLLEYMLPKASGDSVDETAMAAQVESAVREIVHRQADIGIDVIDDGEMSKPGFQAYISQRLDGVEVTGKVSGAPWSVSREAESFPEFYAWEAEHSLNPIAKVQRVACTGPLKYVGHDAVQKDIENLKAAAADTGAEELFMPAISPANVEGWIPNEYYPSQEEYVTAIAEALHEEYKAITDAGLILQIDDPRLITYYVLQPSKTMEECKAWGEVRVEAVNHALNGIPKEQVRFHTCYSIDNGPRIHDMELKDCIDLILKVNAGAVSFEASNPRHEHEWTVWRDTKLPDDLILIPGVITHCSQLVEHPELISQRLQRYADIVGKERVIAGSDCGFGSVAGKMDVHPTVVWAKLQSLVEGARLATEAVHH